MAIVQGRGRTSITGKRLNPYRGKRLFERGSLPAFTKIAPKKAVPMRTKGGHLKYRLLTVDEVNLFNPKTKKFTKAKIITVKDNPANRHFIRRNILTKGAIVETDKGKARLTSRPGQEKAVNAIAIE